MKASLVDRLRKEAEACAMAARTVRVPALVKTWRKRAALLLEAAEAIESSRG